MTPIAHHATAQPGPPPGLRALPSARRHRATLLRCIQSVERALAAPADGSGWRDRLVARLRDLDAEFAEHVTVTEGPAGLYAELLDHAPRLARRVTVLVREHAAITAAVRALLDWTLRPDTTAEQVRDWSSDLLRELSRHRQRGADLVYDAYQTDIGGET